MTREERAKRDCGYDDNGSNYSRGYGDTISIEDAERLAKELYELINKYKRQ